MDALINVVLPVFGIILTGYLAGRFEALGPDSAAALNRFVFYFALPAALFVFTARAPIDKIFNWPFIRAFISGALLTLLIALIIGRLWFHHHDVATLSMVGLTAGWGNIGYMGLPLLLTAYGPDGALPTIVSVFVTLILFVGSTIAVLEGTRASGPSPLRMAAHLAGMLLRNPLVISPLLGILFSMTELPLPKAVSNYLDLMAAAVAPAALFALGLSLSQADRQYGRGDMALNAESHRQSHFDVCASHLRICYGPVVVTCGRHTLGNACCRKRLRHRSAI